MTDYQGPPDRPYVVRRALSGYLRAVHTAERTVDRTLGRVVRTLWVHRMNVENRFGPVTTRAERVDMAREMLERMSGLSEWRTRVPPDDPGE